MNNKDIHIRAKSRMDIAKNDWDAIVESSANGLFAHKWYLSEAFASWKGRTDLSIAVYGDDIIPVALIPLQLVHGKYLRIFKRYSLESYGGILFTQKMDTREQIELLNRILELLRDSLRDYGADYISFVVPFFKDGDQASRFLKIYNSCGMKVTQSGTWVVNLKISEDLMWQSLGGKQRNTIRKAHKSDIRIRKASDADLQAYYELHVSTCHRTNINPHPRKYFEHIWDNFFKTGDAMILIAEKNGQVIAGQTFQCFRGIATYWTGASNLLARNTGANSLLQWEAMRYFRNLGFDFFENGWKSDDRTNKSGAISKFKASFGGTVFPIYRFELRNHLFGSRCRNSFQDFVNRLRSFRRR